MTIDKTGKGVQIHDEDTSISFEKAAVTYMHSKLGEFERMRSIREDIWLECWGLYLGSPEARAELKAMMLRSVGNVNTEWRHNLNTGKAYEQVETIVAYLQQAFFPNRDWFDAQPLHPGYAELSRIIKNFTLKKLKQANFITHWEMFLRQMCITGQSVLALPWRYDEREVTRNYRKPNGQVGQRKKREVTYNNNDFEVLDIFDIYTDYSCHDIEKAPLIRRFLKDKAEVMELLDTGVYSGITKKEVMELDGLEDSTFTGRHAKEAVERFQGIQTNSLGDTLNEKVELFEYWGDLVINGYYYRDHYAVFTSNHLLQFEPNPFNYGKPFVFGTYTPIVRSPVALGVIEPVLGLIHELDIITNQRLDSLELSVDTMWEMVDDGSLAPEEIYTKPGKVFPVSQPNTLIPIQSSKNFIVTYDEAVTLEQRIDKNNGTGNFISANTARSGERVTATEVQATKDAGGNRLSNVHKHIEETSLIPFLDKLFKSYQQFIIDEEIVRIPSESIPDAYDFVAVGLEDFENDFRLVPVGADHVADKEYEVNQLMTFLQVAGGNEQMASMLNFENILYDLARKMGIDDIDQFINKPEAPEEPMMPQMPMQQQEQTVEQQVGKPMANYMEASLSADGGQQLAKDMLGLDLEQADISKAMQSAM